ncbi:MAG: hypothetical protein AAF962_08550 [Actinomycetota bacterium]
MATIVEEVTSGNRYVLLGAGFGAYNAVSPHVLLGSLAPNREKGEYTMICVCDAYGQVGWLYSESVRVVSVDGQLPTELLSS